MLTIHATFYILFSYLCQDNNFETMELTVTAIQFVLAPDEPDREKRVEVAEAFLAGLEEGQEVLLKAEPMNPVDVNAVAAFMDYRQIGYLTKESAVKVEPLLDDKGQCKAVVKGSDNHLALFLTVPDVPEAKPSPILRERTLPESPLGLSVRLGIASDESREQLIASNLAEMEVTKENMPEILHLAELYLPLMNLSICYEDSLWLTEIDRKLDDARTRWQELGVEVEDAAMLSRIYDNVHEAAGDLHTTATHVPERIFRNHLDRLRQNKAITQPFFKKYCDTVLDGKDFCLADRNKMAAEQDRLLGWLKGMKWDELRDPDNLRMMGYRVNYLRLSRQELYDLYSVLLLIEKLKSCCHKAATNSILMSEQAMVYWKQLEEHGFVDAEFKLTKSTTRQQAMLIADVFAEKLGISSKWKSFERFWGIKNLAQEKYHYQETGIISSREREITNIFKE